MRFEMGPLSQRGAWGGLHFVHLFMSGLPSRLVGGWRGEGFTETFLHCKETA